MTEYWKEIPFAKGFLLTRQNFQQVAHYEETKLPGGWRLWTDEATETEVAFTSAGDFAILRGHWVDTSDDAEPGGTAQQILASIKTGNQLALHRRTARLGGRFTLIVRFASTTWVYTDATGLRSIYYSREQSLVASHLNLLLKLDPGAADYTVKGTMRAVDYTPYPHIRQLLPNFRLNPENSSVERYFPFEANRFEATSSTSRLELVETIWGRVMEHYLQRTNRLALSITGGLDSKLMLAMCGSNSDRFASYTYGVTETSDARTKSLNFDWTQVEKMLPHLDLDSHQFLDITERNPTPEELKSLISTNSWGNHAPYLVPMYRELFPGDGWFHLRGTGVEIIRRYWPYKSNDFADLLIPLRNAESPPLETRAQELGYNQPQFGYNLMDLVYWEIRMGKWHAEILNEQDAAFETFLPISVRDIYELLLAFPENERGDATAVLELINRNNPLLNFWGANDHRNIYEQWRDSIQKTTPEENSPGAYLWRNRKPDPIGLPDKYLSIPMDQFRSGSWREVDLFEAEQAGALRVLIDQPYRKRRGEGYFEWQVTLDGHAVVSCDGALTTTPTAVTIWNMPPKTRIGVKLISHKDGPVDSDSWEKASRLLIRDTIFYPEHLDGDEKLSIGCDNPYAKIAETKEIPGTEV